MTLIERLLDKSHKDRIGYDTGRALYVEPVEYSSPGLIGVVHKIHVYITLGGKASDHGAVSNEIRIYATSAGNLNLYTWLAAACDFVAHIPSVRTGEILNDEGLQDDLFGSLSTSQDGIHLASPKRF